MNEHTGDVIIWNNRYAVDPETLWPNYFNGENRGYRDPLNPYVYDGIISGRLTLYGLVIYQDLENNNYVMRIKAVKNGNRFDIKYLYFGTPFGELKPK